MKFLANENIPMRSIHRLRADGHDVSSVIQDSPGATDETVLARAHAEQCIILTFDRDYGELIYRRHLPPPPGIVYFRFAPRTPETPAERLIQLLETGHITLEAKLTIIGREWVRQRALPQQQREQRTDAPQ